VCVCVCVCVSSNQIHWPIFLYFICNVFILYNILFCLFYYFIFIFALFCVVLYLYLFVFLCDMHCNVFVLCDTVVYQCCVYVLVCDWGFCLWYCTPVFFGCLCDARSTCLGDGIMLCVWYVFCIGCWCIAGVCNCVLVSMVFVCDAVIHIWM